MEIRPYFSLGEEGLEIMEGERRRGGGRRGGGEGGEGDFDVVGGGGEGWDRGMVTNVEGCVGSVVRREEGGRGGFSVEGVSD